eukprot:3513880-Rhodomonas_salina.7
MHVTPQIWPTTLTAGSKSLHSEPLRKGPLCQYRTSSLARSQCTVPHTRRKQLHLISESCFGTCEAACARLDIEYSGTRTAICCLSTKTSQCFLAAKSNTKRHSLRTDTLSVDPALLQSICNSATSRHCEIKPDFGFK